MNRTDTDIISSIKPILITVVITVSVLFLIYVIYTYPGTNVQKANNSKNKQNPVIESDDDNKITLNPKYTSDDYLTLKDNYTGTPSCKDFNDKSLVKLTINKNQMNEFLRKRGLPVPNGVFLNIRELRSMSRDPEYFRLYLNTKVLENNLSFPLVLKPSNDTGGNGIVTGITDFDKLYSVISDYIADTSNKSHIIIEEQKTGIVYRILYVNKNLVGLVAREVPSVVGDGRSTIQELMDAYNDSLLKAKSKQHPIRINDPYIGSQGFIRNDVLPTGVDLKVNNVLNYLGGAKTYALPLNTIHPVNKAMFDKLLNSDFPSNCLGIDFISKDISVPYLENGAVILEFNSNPARKLHDVMDRNFKGRYMKEIRELRNNN